MKTTQTKKQKAVLQIVALPKTAVKEKVKNNGKTNGHSNGLLGKNTRNFETRFIPRYTQMPVVPEGLPEPSFSESSNRILKERYLLKGGNLEAVETVTERFWHIAYDIASADLDFGASSKEVFDTAKNFYTVMVKQQFLPNSPTIMNAGKQNQLQYSACFVLPIDDSIPSIFDTMKYAALIHQTGGGCISADARVWTTFCGVEPIETLFARATVDGRVGIKQGSGIAYDVSDLNIRTTSMDPKTGKTGLKKVTHVWKYEVPEDQQIVVTTKEGTTIQTSNWHPFMVVREDKLVEVRADQLTKGDIVLGPNKPDKFWPWRKLRKVGFFAIDQDLAWLIGFTLGDGSFGYVPALRQYRVRWFSGTEDVLKKVQMILAKLNIKVSIQKDKRGLLTVATLNQKFVHNLLEACGLEKIGPKDQLIRVPEIIAKSPLKVVKAFIAGLLDSDGYVASDGSPSYSTVSKNLSEDLAALMSLLGFHPTVVSKLPYGKGRLTVYSVQLCPLPQVNQLASEIGEFLANHLRVTRLVSSSSKQTALPLNFRAFRDVLAKLGLVKERFDKAGAGPLAKELNYWASHGRIDRESLHSIAKVVASPDKKFAEFLQRIADVGHEVIRIEKAAVAKLYYDLSVKDWNTYAAGQSGMVMIHNTGFAFSRLRPAGSIVKRSGGVASGPVSFLRVYDAATQSIKQGGTRRGANMGILRIDHPDILEFIRCKAVLDEQNKPVYDGVKDLLPDDNSRNLLKTLLLDRQISNFNISAAVTDKFMEAYAKGEEYDLIDPHTKEVTGRLDARAVFDEIVERAWHTGDPGLIFIDRINKSPSNPVSKLETIESTNPSLRAGTKVLTKEGIFPIESLDRKRFYVKNLYGQWSLAECFLSGRDKKLYRITLGNGREVYATAEHKWPVLSVGGGFGKVSTSNLKSGNILPFPEPEDIQFESQNKNSREQGFMLGWLYGDGWITQRGKKESNSILYQSNPVTNMTQGGLALMQYSQPANHLYAIEEKQQKDMCFGFLFSEEDKPLAEIVLQEVNKLKQAKNRLLAVGDHTYTIQVTSAVFAENLIGKFGVDKKAQGLPTSVWQSGGEFVKGVIDGLFSSDGFVSKKRRYIVFTTKHKKLAEDVSDLLSFYGIKSMVNYTEISSANFPNGKKYSKTYGRYDVGINGYHAINFAGIFNLSHKRKQENLRKMVENYSTSRKEPDARLIRVVSVKETDLRENVWDISVFDETHCFYINHCITGNCGEQPLAPWDACNLGSINLGKFVKEDGTDVDWDGLKKVTRDAVHFLDNVVQTNPYTLPEIYEEVHKNRRIGLGVMGWADMLFRLKIAYDSAQALELAEKVMRFINDEGHKISEELAEKRGPFPNWANSIYADKNDPAFKNRGKSYAYSSAKPIRNSTITTIAPTGTISIIGDCSSGIEPVFALAYIHRAKGDGGKTGNEMRYLTIANKTFTEIGKNEGFYNDELAQKVMDQGSVRGVEDVPTDWQSVFVTAPEIHPDWHVKMQAAFQKYTDNGVSKTINLPNSATEDDIKKAYLMAWETGCSGITVYRDGSKTTQVLNVSSTLKPASEESKAAEGSVPSPVAGRPMVLRGRTYKVMTPVGEAYITLNRDEHNQPFEVFITVGRGGMHTMADAEAMGRLMSLSLRLARSANSVDPTAVAQKIVSQLRGIGGASHVGFGKDRVMSLADAIAKVLAEELALGEQQQNEKQSADPIPLNLVEEAPSVNTGSDDVVRSSSMAQADLCPECGNATFVREDGCQKCYSCGYSKC